MAIRKDYYIVDDFGDVWNQEALPTFNQASQFRGMIKPLINRITDLKIISVVRGMTRFEPIKKEVKPKKDLYGNSDF